MAKIRSVMSVGVCLAIVPTTSCGAAASGEASASLDGRASRTPLVVFERSGGLAGTVESLRISREGLAVRTPRSRTLRLGSREMHRLRSALERADIATLPRSTISTRPTPDGFQYAVSAGGRTVRTYAGSAPPRLRPLLATLNTLLARIARRRP